MKIDLHTHTKKCKTGDAPTREITPSDFCETILATDVGIVAITNHNFFDLKQYRDIDDASCGLFQIWPGIELDVIEDGSRGHLLVIVSPSNTEEFAKVITELTNNYTPDTFNTSIAEVLSVFEPLEPIYIAHYEQKTPNISDESLAELVSGTAHPGRVIKEVTNSISAGIYIRHGHASIYGSDVHDWSTYINDSNDLPDLRLPVESFEHFCLLLEKDATTINTTLDKKNSEELTLTPFGDGSFLKLRVYNDINVVFGPKGTGKTCILKAIANNYSEAGIDAEVFTSTSDRLDEIFDIRGRGLSLNLNSHDINYCKDEIEFLRQASEVDVTSISRYISFFQTKITNKNAQKLKFKDLETEEEGVSKREFNNLNEGTLNTQNFLDFLSNHSSVSKILTNEEHTELSSLLNLLLDRLRAREWETFSEWKEISLLNSAIEKIRIEIERKTGSPAKPITTGFRDYARNRIKIAVTANKILDAFDSSIPVVEETLGSIGRNKGDLVLRTEFQFQNGTVTDGELNKMHTIKKGSQKQFSRKIRDIYTHVFSDSLFRHIAALNEIEDIEVIETVYELLLFKRYFSINGNRYIPSSGESSMVMLHKELETEKDIYILDEPERSLGNEYINDVVVPLLKERARVGKKIFISTHDANIAVRTLPYSSIYRGHGVSGYTTHIGNPFSNNLINPLDSSDIKDWKKISMITLEGGEDAFGERGKIYGNT